MQPSTLLDSLFGKQPYTTLAAQIRDFAILFIDPQGQIVSWNEGARLLFGYEADEVIGQPFRCLFVQEDQKSGVPERELQKAETTGRAEDMRWHQRKDESRFWANGVTTSIHDALGNLRGFAKIARDDTARKLAEDELRDARARLQNILTAGSVATWDFDIVNNIMYPDVNLLRFFSISPDEANGGPFQKYIEQIHPDDKEKVNEHFTYAMESGEPYEVEYRVIQSDGTVKWLSARGKVEKDGQGNPVRLPGVVLDITQRRESEEAVLQAHQQAEQANRIKDQFLGTLSHELRTPLNAILGWANILRLHEMDRETQQQGLETIERNARAQAQLIEDLLDVSRILTGKMRLELHPVELSQLVNEAVSNVMPSAQTKGIRLGTDIDYSVGLISGDPDRLGQVLWNLLSNAIKFTPRGGRIRVTVERIDSSVEVRVSDNGQGMAPEFLPYVFERFRQADASSTRAHGGLGIGLALVRHLTEAHGGTVRAESLGEGEGSTFSLCFPLVAMRPEAAEKANAPIAIDSGLMAARDVKLPPLSGLRILVADDEADTQILLRVVLTQRGASVEVAGDARTAFAHIQQSLAAAQPFDVMVSDVGMPGEDGYSLIRRVRTLEAENGGFLPAIALTAYASHKDRVEALMAGFQMHVAKPVDALELVASIASLKGRMGNLEAV
ncbi:PAS domain S-box protein [bacterium]|nr:MAG: PAS domain S-box protein [bacterium]